MTTSGILYLVATPIGHLDDLSLRAIETLKSVDCIACEHPLHSQKLLKHYGIKTPTCRYHQHNEYTQTQGLIKRLLKGDNLALISDAGTPLMSDPGYPLVQMAHSQSIRVSAIPGPCAAITALVASGLPCHSHLFYGFLPAKAQARQTTLTALASLPYTLIFYESPRRLLATLNDCLTLLGPRQACVGRELTKHFESIIQAPLDQLIAQYSDQPIQGECVLLIAGQTQTPDSLDQQQQYDFDVLCQHLSIKQACQIGAKLWNIPKNTLYKLATSMKKQSAGPGPISANPTDE